jgi:hypothetical protein
MRYGKRDNVIETPGFARFWSIWPRNSGGYTRKGAKSKCLQVWLKNYNETQAELICRHVEWLSGTADWLKDGGAYIPAPLVYLHQSRWDGAEIPEQVKQESWLDEYESHKAAAVPPPAGILAMVRKKA